MNKKLAFRLATISGVTIGGFLGGIAFERSRCNTLIRQSNNPYVVHVGDEVKKLTSMPGLPVFGTVSAATAFVPDTANPAQMANVGEIMKYGFPGLDNVRSYSDYVLSYDRRNRVAHWVFEHLTPDRVAGDSKVDRSKCEFKPDESIHPFFRSLNSDYKGSGFDRGHLAAAGNHKTHQMHCEQTFYLTNMAPQVGSGFNRDAWNNLERYVRKLTKTYPNVYVCTGPLYLPKKEADGKAYVKYQVIGNNNVAVPTHFYKVIVGQTASGQLELQSFVMPNQVIDDKTPLNTFMVPPESIERSAGLLFFDKISRKQLSKINGKAM